MKPDYRSWAPENLDLTVSIQVVFLVRPSVVVTNYHVIRTMQKGTATIVGGRTNREIARARASIAEARHARKAPEIREENADSTDRTDFGCGQKRGLLSIKRIRG
jgi:V8-like Glu-specific endopeptidase